MLNSANLILCLVTFLYIAFLPRKFFRKGAQLNREWWLTAAPLFVCPAVLAMSYFSTVLFAEGPTTNSIIQTLFFPIFGMDSPWLMVTGMLSVLCASLSILLMGFSIGTHRIPIYMFHDRQDSSGAAPHLVTWGPYRYIRHPIYASYLMALWASFLFTANLATLLCLVYGTIVLTSTASKEEAQLCHSPELGEEYKTYMKTTRRFLPPLSAISVGRTNDQSEVELSTSRTPQPTERA